MIPRVERPEVISPFPITTNRTEAEWIARPALGPGGRIFYRRHDGKYFWNKDRPHITEPVFVSRSFIINSPLKAYFDFTNRCNLQCLHCITSSSPYADISTELPTPRILELTSELADIGVLEVATAGGEPFVHPEWENIFRHITSAGLNLIITTNGSLLTPNLVDRLKQTKPLEVRVSLDGGPKFHEHIRGSRSYLKAMTGLSNLAKGGLNATARLTLCRGVNEELPTLFEDIASAGVQTAKIAVVKEGGRAATGTGRHLLGFIPDESAAEKLMSLGKEYGLTVQLSADDFPVTVDKANDPKLRDLERQNCGAGFESCYISPNGELQSCVTMPDLAFGLLHTESFRTAWQGKLAEEFRRLANDSQERRLCDVFCSHHPKDLTDIVHKI